MEQPHTLESVLKITQSADKSAAYLEFIEPVEDFTCSLPELEQFVERNQIRFGVIDAALAEFSVRPELFLHTKTLIAKGKQPVHGVDGYVMYADIMLQDDEHKPLEHNNGVVDYKELTRLKNVRKGQLIAELVAPEPGVPGIAVTNEEIPYKEGKQARFKVGKNVVIHPEGIAMYAAIDGLVTKTDNDKINVFPVYEINGDVDYSIGNVDFVGTVVIRGNVLTGFRVRADGDIRVIGGVEGAEIEASGSVEISSGIIGYNKGHVKAGQDVKCSFIQDGNVIAGVDILVSQSIMHSHVRAGRNVTCGGPKGLIVGGSIQAGERVSARTVGNTMSTLTSIEVGVLPELRNELTTLRDQLKLQLASMDKTNKALHILDQLAAAGQLTPDKLAMRVKLSATQKSSEREAGEIKVRIFEIEKMLEDTTMAKVEVKNVIYGGSKIVIGRYTKYIKDPVSRMSFYYFDGDITMSALA